MELLTTVQQLRDWRTSKSDNPCAAVFTMGALHQGHVELMGQARSQTRKLSGREPDVITSIFVNPTQFSDAQDLAKYPRTLEADIVKCRAIGVDAVFAPTAHEIYPSVIQVSVQPGPLGNQLEGESRPGHFAGVLTVVNKLLNLTQPQYAFFGEKDYQQLTLIQQMVQDLNMPVEIIGVPTVREFDGLAMSSRNAQLSPHGRQTSRQVPETLFRIRDLVSAGEPLAGAMNRAISFISNFPDVTLDYLVALNPNMLSKPTGGKVRILIAATIENVRLIDNIELEIP